MDLQTAIGILPGKRSTPQSDPFLFEYANLKLAAIGKPIVGKPSDYPFLKLTSSILRDFQEKSRLLDGHLSPVDARIQNFLDDYLRDLPAGESRPKLPAETFVVDRHGLARMISLPAKGDYFSSEIVETYRLHQGVLHNPRHDRRTTQGVFHVSEGGIGVPGDKFAVPKLTFCRLLARALQPPRELMRLPFTHGQEAEAEVWVSLLLRPVVCPEVPGGISAKRYECRFFAPGNLVGNLDFVESIFGNAGDPFLPDNDSALDAEGWTGHTGCVILAPHLIRATKREMGLPHVSGATERQRRDGMCWEREDELYNNGGAFKITARDARGIIVTLIADNYFGYCKKEVKTQISYSANLYGVSEEEHSGGAVAFPAYDLGEGFVMRQDLPDASYRFAEMAERMGDAIEQQPEGHAVDRLYPDIFYVPEDAEFSLGEQQVTWKQDGEVRSIRLRPGAAYVYPSGYRVEMVRRHAGRRWRLIGTVAEGTYCHKPCTVSGGGKSEISKSIADAMIYGPVFVADFAADFDRIEEILKFDFSKRYREASKNTDHRPILSPARSLGSVIKLLTPAPEYTDEYNAWLASIPSHVKELVYVVKRFWKPDWEENWRARFSVDRVNGKNGNELKYRKNKLVAQYLRVGFMPDGSWRTFGLRKDFSPALKLQLEDDITASAVFPTNRVIGLGEWAADYVKLAQNCEYRLFQRPDEAIHRGYDRRTELDMAQPGNFLSNYAPLTRAEVEEIANDTIRFDQYTDPIKKLVRDFLAASQPEYLSLPSHPRIVGGKPTKNPRYLQDRDDLVDPRSFYLGMLGPRLFRRLPPHTAPPIPVGAVLPGRRNNPPEEGVRPLAVFNPLHYLPLPEFFMEVISSMTGKSPSTTGAGSEGALTKSPFNALPPIVDLNNALVSLLLTGHPAFVSAAGHIGPDCRVDHDISLLVPEIWCRMRLKERDPAWLLKHKMIEKCEDFEFGGKTVRASLLGYRITEKFVNRIFGRMFANPDAVFPEEMLRPEKQSLGVFADGMDNIVTTHERVARMYFEDGSIEGACPPLVAILHIMRDGHWQGKTLADPEVRGLFDRDAMLASGWYKARLECRARLEVGLWESHEKCLHQFLHLRAHEGEAARLDIPGRLEGARRRLAEVRSPGFAQSLSGTLGTDPYFHPQS